MRVLLVPSANGKIDVAGRSFYRKANLQLQWICSQCVVQKKKFSRSDIQLPRLGTWIRMNQRFFTSFANKEICKPHCLSSLYLCLYLYLVPVPVPSFVLPRVPSVQAFNVQAYLALNRSKPAVTRRKPVPVYLFHCKEPVARRPSWPRFNHTVNRNC